jgi:beta-lactamase superfamily II metal-dependent hydrolase
LDGSNLDTPPQDDQIEVSLLGPGYGESIVVHLGHGQWCIVDSCLNRSKTPAQLEYLKTIGINVGSAVSLVVATHWHDNHVGGIGQVLRECSSAEFVCSVALRTDEFIELTKLRDPTLRISSGVNEFRQIMQVLDGRGGVASSLGTPNWAAQNTRIWARNVGPQFSIPTEIFALSPSNTSITLAKHALAALVPMQESKKRLVSQKPNHVAVVLAITAGNNCVLLGSDLENASAATGWVAIVTSGARPQAQSSVFKVPHHGSQNADEPTVWSQMLAQDTIAILTPFQAGSIVLPKQNDAQRILGHTRYGYCTATPKSKVNKARPKMVLRQISENTKSIREVPASTGMVRLRRNAWAHPATMWDVELFGTAVHLSQI